MKIAAKYSVFSILLFFSTVLAKSEVPSVREYINSGIERIKTRRIGLSQGIDTHIQHFRELHKALPDEETSFKVNIARGISALELMRDETDDSNVRDISLLGVEFSKYYRKNEEAFRRDPDTKISKAFFTFLGTDATEGGGPPPRFFEYLLGPLFYKYLNYYNLKGMEKPIPDNVKNAMVDSLEWVTRNDDLTGAPLFNAKLIYYFAEFQDLVEKKVAELDAKQRAIVFDELEVSLKYNDMFSHETATKARSLLEKLIAASHGEIPPGRNDIEMRAADPPVEYNEETLGGHIPLRDSETKRMQERPLSGSNWRFILGATAAVGILTMLMLAFLRLRNHSS